MKPAKRGFTLIELLVVIAIIAILAAILFPVYARIKEKAKQTMCLAHGKQLGTAMMVYIGDYDERVMIPLPRAEWGQTIGTWKSIDGSPRVFTTRCWSLRFGRFNDYVKSGDIWICPSARWYFGERYALGYQQTWICRVCTDADPPNDKLYAGDPNMGGKLLAEIEQEMPPTKKIAWWCASLNWTDPAVGIPYTSHNGGSIYIYLDGHAAWSKVGRYWAPPGYPAQGLNPPYN